MPESPPIQAEVPESPLTSLPHQHQDKRRLEVGRAADDQNPEVRMTTGHQYHIINKMMLS